MAESVTEVQGRGLHFSEPKTYERRSVTLPAFLVEKLTAHMKDRPDEPDAFVFASPEGSTLNHRNFYRRNFKPALEQWWDIHHDEPWRIENAMNHIHLFDFVGDEYDDSELPMLERAAEHVAEAWRAAPAVQLPGHNLEVTIATKPDEYGPTVSCHRRAS